MKVSVVIPVYRSERILPTLYARLKAVLEAHCPEHEILLVDDCSPDESWRVICSLCNRDPRVKGIQLMKNSGQGCATLAGITISEGEAIVTLDDDLQHPPEEIPALLKVLHDSPDLDIVIGVPIEKKHHPLRRMGSFLMNWVNSIALDKDPGLRFTGFRAMTGRVGAELVRIATPYPALGPMMISITRRIRNVPVTHAERTMGKSNYTFRKLLRQTLSNFIGYSMFPLRILAFVGFVGVVCSLSVSIFFILRYMAVGIEVPGWMSLLLILVFLSGFNFFAFALLGEYILRIFQMSSIMPNYTIRKVAQQKQGES